MKREFELTASDFVRCPIWIGVHNFDAGQPWYEEADEETVRPWTGEDPFSEGRGTAIIEAQFRLADGSIYSGYCRAVPASWDAPEIVIGNNRDGEKGALSWSEMHGGNPASLILLQTPVMFAEGRSFDFQLRTPKLRQRQIRDFFGSLKRKPGDVFPIQFSGVAGLTSGIVSGTVEGFFSFPLWNAEFEISTGESYLSNLRSDGKSQLDDVGVAGVASYENNISVADQEPDAVILADVIEREELKPGDFQVSPIWLRTKIVNQANPFPPQYRFKPWMDTLPADATAEYFILSAIFRLKDGSEFNGYARPVPENWADTRASDTRISATHVIQGITPSERFGGSALAIIGEHHPCLFIGNKGFRFWCGPRTDAEAVRQSFYEVLGLAPDQVFPIHFSCRQGLTTGIISGEILGFYEMQWTNGKPPKVVR